jgi:transposase InsO family protein
MASLPPPAPPSLRPPQAHRLCAHPAGDLCQLDTLDVSIATGHHFKHLSLINVVSRYGLAELRTSATAMTARERLERMLARAPFPFQGIQVDGGSEFMAEFEDFCQQRGLRLFVLPTRSPKLNGCVERFQRTHQDDFYGCADDSPDLATLRIRSPTWEVVYNTIRPHQVPGHAHTVRIPSVKLPPPGRGTSPRGVAHVPNQFTLLTTYFLRVYDARKYLCGQLPRGDHAVCYWVS